MKWLISGTFPDVLSMTLVAAQMLNEVKIDPKLFNVLQQVIKHRLRDMMGKLRIDYFS